MAKRASGAGAVTARGTALDRLHGIERAEQRLWVLALLIFLLLAISLFLLDASSTAAQFFISGVTRRFVEIVSSAETSLALMLVVLLICAYFYEKLGQLRRENRELISALDSSAVTLSEQHRQLETWAQLSHTLITNFNLPRLLDLIVRTAADVTRSDCAAVMLVEPGSRSMRLAAIRERGLQNELARRVAARVIESGHPLYLQPAALPEEFDRPELAWGGLTGLAAAPLVTGGQRVGALLVGRLQPREPFSESVIQTLRSFANQASIALEKAELYAENQRQLDRLGKLLEELRQTQAQIPAGAIPRRKSLARTISHAINANLADVLARTARLLEQSSDNGTRDDIDALRVQTARTVDALGVVLSHLLEPSNGKPTSDVNRLLQQAIALMKPDWQRRGAQVAEAYGDVPAAAVPASCLQQALVRLLTAASQATAGEGKVSVRTSAPRPDHLLIELDWDAAWAGRDAHGGLAAARSIIERHGGSMDLVDNPRTRIEIRLPSATGVRSAEPQPVHGGARNAVGG